MGLSESEAAELARLQALAAQPDAPVVSDAAAVAVADATVEVARVNAEAVVELAHINADADLARAEVYAEGGEVGENARLADAENTAAIALAIAVETAAVIAEQSGAADPSVGDPPAGDDTSDGGNESAPASGASESAEGDEPPGTKHEQPKPGEAADGKKPHWYARTIGG